VRPDGTVITHSHAAPGHQHHHEHPSGSAHQVLHLNTDILHGNARAAEQNRGAFQALKLLALNVVSSPGAGKTALLTRTLTDLRGRLRCGVIVGDLATENDAARLRPTGAAVVPIATGTLCHLEAGMVAAALAQLDLRALDFVVIENVGNLVCPAAFDLGESLRVVLHSVTEGEDKPLKYPPLFQSADVVVITKTDLAEAAGFDRELALKNVRQAAPRAQIFEASAKTGTGVAAWCEFLVNQVAARRAAK
jgi:hydrogenase nickel incorporation protein HypB